MRLERARFQFGVKLHADEPGVIGEFDGFRQQPVGRNAGEDQALFLEPGAIGGVDFVAVAVALGNFQPPIDLCDFRAGFSSAR